MRKKQKGRKQEDVEENVRENSRYEVQLSKGLSTSSWTRRARFPYTLKIKTA